MHPVGVPTVILGRIFDKPPTHVVDTHLPWEQ